MNKNPFSLYDFLGYLFPGLTAMLLIVYIVCIEKDAPIEDYFTIKSFVNVFKDKIELKWLETTVIIILFSYIAGHIVAYLSSVTVEYFANRVFGYPSYYLLHDEESTYKTLYKNYFKYDANFGNSIWRGIIMMIMFPVSILLIVIGIPLRLIKFIARPLDRYIISSIRKKLSSLSDRLGLESPDVNSHTDYHRIVMHYVYLNIAACQRKTDNYVAIYGFLRAMTLIVCLFFDYLLIVELRTVSFRPFAVIDFNAIWILLGLFILCNVIFMGFIKFYRRFTLENYMALLTEIRQTN